MKSEITTNIINWAQLKGILQNSTPQNQFIKLIEELGELSQGIQKAKEDDIKDAIGDCVVVLTILAEMYGMPIDECVWSAYNEIKGRTGTMQNGVFKKD